MRSYELVCRSLNSVNYPKAITVLVMEPEVMKPTTGIMLFTHGWGGNRFQHADKMEYACELHDLVCVSVEFRMSGYDFDAVTGRGSYLPYDAGFLQTFDVIAGLRAVTELRPMIDTRRVFHYGGSQGGGIALATSIFLPNTFAFVYASCPVTRADEAIRGWTGREFAPYELSIRDVVEHADEISCPVYVEHGTGDTTVPHDRHTLLLERRLIELGKPHRVVYYEGGEHNLEPATTKLEAFKAMADEPLRTVVRDGAHDFARGTIVEIRAADRTLRIDWSKRSDDISLFSWR